VAGQVDKSSIPRRYFCCRLIFMMLAVHTSDAPN
jgi:hypothetical protein